MVQIMGSNKPLNMNSHKATIVRRAEQQEPGGDKIMLNFLLR